MTTHTIKVAFISADSNNNLNYRQTKIAGNISPSKGVQRTRGVDQLDPLHEFKLMLEVCKERGYSVENDESLIYMLYLGSEGGQLTWEEVEAPQVGEIKRLSRIVSYPTIVGQFYADSGGGVS
jgi:hypothetical protein